MYYEPSAGHGLRHDPFKAIVAPRPIGWISTLDQQGRPNLAPYSFFNAMSTLPHMVGFTSVNMKHSMFNAKASGEFVYNLVHLPLLDAMNQTSLVLEAGVSEFDVAGIEMAPCRVVKAPRVAASPAALECKVVNFLEFNDIDGNLTDRYLIVGQVVGVHIDECYIKDGRFDIVSVQPVARCGYRDYSVVSEVVEVMPPAESAMQVL
jgi:flavin reductase (DIM6/NTAB) family NADH-FMN oxidoreductase RutF